MKNLINQKFSRLTVIKKTDERDSSQRIIWECVCDCGQIRFVNTSALTGGTVIECEKCAKQRGLNKRKETNAKRKIKNDLTGKRFNRLTVIEPTEKRASDRCIIWKCQCDCGNEVEVSSKNLTQNNTKSCGCLNTETRAALGRTHKKDLTGQVFGRLTVMKDSGKRTKDNGVLWQCICQCGNKPLIRGSYLLNGHTQSCGCLLSKGEAYIAELLSQNNIQFETQKTFDTCIFPDTGRKARFDFWVNNTYVIEYDGEQHFQASSSEKSWNTEENLEKTRQRDSYKNQWCLDNNIPIIRIPYTLLKNLTIEDLIYDG